MRDTILEGLQEHLTAKRAWIALGLGVAAFELFCNEDQLMSKACDRGMEHSRYASAVIQFGAWVTAAHLTNTFERLGIEKADPFIWAHKLTR